MPITVQSRSLLRGAANFPGRDAITKILHGFNDTIVSEAIRMRSAQPLRTNGVAATVPPAPACVISSSQAPWRRRPGAWLRLCCSHSAFSGGTWTLVGEPWHEPVRVQSARHRRYRCEAAAEQMQVAITGAGPVERSVPEGSENSRRCRRIRHIINGPWPKWPSKEAPRDVSALPPGASWTRAAAFSLCSPRRQQRALHDRI